MNGTYQKDEFTTVFNQPQPARASRSRNGLEKLLVDLVSNSHASSQNSGENGETGFVSPTEEKRRQLSAAELQFLELLSEGHTVGEACVRAGVVRATIYRKRHEDYVFERLWDQALDIAGDRLEEEADRRGFTGWEEVIQHKSGAVSTRRRYSDRMLMFRLRALKPGRYRNVRG
jgi:hypothetical protein